MADARIEKIKKIVERLKNQKKHKLHIKGKKAKDDKTAAAKKPVDQKAHGAGRPKKGKAVMQGPHGGEYVVLGNGKKKYGVSKSMLENFVHESDLHDFVKKHKGDK